MWAVTKFGADKSVDAAKMRSILDMQIIVADRMARAAFDQAMGDLQPHLPSIAKRGRIVIKDKVTKEIIQSTAFAKWEDIHAITVPMLRQHGFTIRFRTSQNEGRVEVSAILSHIGGHREESMLSLPADTTGSKNNVQAIGSAISYAKRYVFCSMLNIITHGEDDDGAATDQPETITAEEVGNLRDMITATKSDEKKFCAVFKVARIEDMVASSYAAAVVLLRQKAAQAA